MMAETWDEKGKGNGGQRREEARFTVEDYGRRQRRASYIAAILPSSHTQVELWQSMHETCRPNQTMALRDPILQARSQQLEGDESTRE
jgi:hypothetical protein